MDHAPLQATANAVSYMVRAVKLEQTVTGSFENLSPGALTEGLSSNAPLPVQVISFTGSQINKSNSLIWTVTDELNIDRYEIERSTNQVNFETIGLIESDLEKENEKQYSIVDHNPNFDNYYRLKIIDFNGEVTFHDKIIFLSNKEDNQMADLLYPNPAFNNIFLDISTTSELEGVELVIFDMIGRVMQTSFHELNSTNTTINIDISNLPKGNYILRYKKEEEQNSMNLKFAKRE